MNLILKSLYSVTIFYFSVDEKLVFMDDVQALLNEISNGFPSTHVVREFLESGEVEKVKASELYLRQQHGNYGLSPEDEANLDLLIDILDDPDPRLHDIYNQYQQN